MVNKTQVGFQTLTGQRGNFGLYLFHLSPLSFARQTCRYQRSSCWNRCSHQSWHNLEQPVTETKRKCISNQLDKLVSLEVTTPSTTGLNNSIKKLNRVKNVYVWPPDWFHCNTHLLHSPLRSSSAPSGNPRVQGLVQRILLWGHWSWVYHKALVAGLPSPSVAARSRLWSHYGCS